MWGELSRSWVGKVGEGYGRWSRIAGGLKAGFK